jgi:hypothetical protein
MDRCKSLSFCYGVTGEIMANEQNLIPIQKGELTREEAKKRGSNGGKKSAQARAEKKLIKDRILERMGAQDWDEYIDGIIARAKESKADAEFLRDTIGEKPVDEQEITVNDDSTKEMDEYFARGSKGTNKE